MKTVYVPIKNNLKLAIDIYGDDGSGNFTDEISVSVVDSNGAYMQDIVIVRENLKEDNKIEVLVFGDENTEDYTDRYNIGIYGESEE